jgi:hypothetical protein
MAKEYIRKVYLECVTDKHNKFYELTENGDGHTFSARHGAIGTSGVIDVYSMNRWTEKLNEKVYNKNYKIISDTGLERQMLQHDVDAMLTKLQLLDNLIDYAISNSPDVKQVWSKWKSGISKTMLRLKEKGIIEKTDLEFCNNIYLKIQPAVEKIQNEELKSLKSN